MLGIEKLKTGCLSIIEFGILTEEVFEDKRVTLTEGFQLAMEGKGIYDAFKEWKEIVEEYKDIDDQERQELKTFWAEKLDLQNDQLEMIIEETFNWLVATDKYRLSLKKAFKKN